MSGRVYGAKGQALAGAQVFVEAGLDGPLRSTTTDASGAYTFADLLPGTLGVFAYAAGYGFDGHSVQVAVADTITGVDLRLTPPGILEGTVRDDSGKVVPGARITRAVVLGESKVGIPFAKLAARGFPTPTTDNEGRFRVTLLPAGAPIAIKIAHREYAQHALDGIRVGDRRVDVRLIRGVLVTGAVSAISQGVPVANAGVFFRNTEPPHDTVMTRSRSDGSFALRLEPGPWVFRAAGASFRTANLRRILVSDQYATSNVAIQVAPLATLRGSVKDARSGDPVENARVIVETFGAPAALARTGDTGAFEISATEGESVLRLGAVPGYLPPSKPAYRLVVTGGQTIEIPTFWVAPIPVYTLEVIDADEQPVEGAVVRLLRPLQFGWRSTNAQGVVELDFASLPADGIVVGLVEHPERPEGALFAIKPDRADDAIVQLLRLTRLNGRVVDGKGRGLEGAVVESRTTLDGFDEAVVLWRTLSGNDGALRWPALVPQVPQLCIATAGGIADGPMLSGRSEAFIAQPGAPMFIKPIVVPEASSGRTLLGEIYEWRGYPLQCGSLAEPKTPASRAAIVVHVPGDHVIMTADGLEHVRKLLGDRALQFAIVTPDDVSWEGSPIPVLRGAIEDRATTYLLDAKGVVVLETFGLPPVSAINDVAPRRND